MKETNKNSGCEINENVYFIKNNNQNSGKENRLVRRMFINCKLEIVT